MKTGLHTDCGRIVLDEHGRPSTIVPNHFIALRFRHLSSVLLAAVAKTAILYALPLVAFPLFLAWLRLPEDEGVIFVPIAFLSVVASLVVACFAMRWGGDVIDRHRTERVLRDAGSLRPCARHPLADEHGVAVDHQ